MALYLIGDVQGCDDALGRLLDEIAFSPSRDSLVLLGDLVNRGPASLEVLRRLQRLGDAAQSLLGNHDLHLLGVAHGARRAGRKDTLGPVLEAPDLDALLDWLSHRSMALHRRIGDADLLMVHAGVLPAWDLAQTLERAAELEAVLRGPHLADFLPAMYGDTPAGWHDGLAGDERLRVIVNALTRMRLCSVDGTMDLEAKGGVDDAPAVLMPWFDVPGRRTASVTIAFGHWSQLGWLSRPGLVSTDTGCVWGGCLSAVRIADSLDDRERIQVHCPQAQAPG